MIGFYGNAMVEALSPFTGQAAQTQAGQGFQALVQALPGLQAQAYQIMNPGNLQALMKREAKLAVQLASESRAERRAVIEAELAYTREQIGQLRAALAPPTPQAPQINAVSTQSGTWVWGLGGLVVAVIVAAVALTRKRR